MRYVNIYDILTEEKVAAVIEALEAIEDEKARFFLESLRKGETVFDTNDAVRLFAMTNALEV